MPAVRLRGDEGVTAEQGGLFDHELPPGFHVGQHVIGRTRLGGERRGIVKGVDTGGCCVLVDCGVAGTVQIKPEKLETDPEWP